jgi:hypothetical protein
MSTTKTWIIWSGEGEVGTSEIKKATDNGIKRILTRERCGGDRWAYAAEYTGNELMDCCAEVKDRHRARELNNA